MDTSTNNINNIQKKIVSEFSHFGDWEKKYKYIIEKGQELPSMDERYRVDSNKVKGCQSDVWLFPEYNEGLVFFHADSNSAIVKGLVSLLMKIFNNQPPQAILKTDLMFLETIDLYKHLSPTRSNGLAAMVKQIKLYAYAIQTKHE